MMDLGFETKCSRSKRFCSVHENILIHNLSEEAEKDQACLERTSAFQLMNQVPHRNACSC